MPAPDRTQIACVRMEPYALWCARQGHPGVPVAVLDERARVLHASPEARALGVRSGLTRAAAESRAPDLHAEVQRAPLLAQRWATLRAELAVFSPRLLDGGPGVAWLTLTPDAAREVAVAFGAQVGLADSAEVAHLASTLAPPGQVELVPGAAGEAALLARLPISALGALGLGRAEQQRLEFLGVRQLADLQRWSRAQRAAFLGAGARAVEDALGRRRTTRLPTHQPDPTLSATLTFDEPLREPRDLDAVLAHLAAQVLAPLNGRAARRVTVQATVAGVGVSATRAARDAVQGATRLHLLARHALNDLGDDTIRMGLDALTLTLGGLERPARQGALFGRDAAQDAVAAVLGRHPQGLVRLRWLDPHATVADAQYCWVDHASGAERPRPLTPHPTPRRTDPTPAAPAPVRR